jgi:hypothetical protein
MEFKEIRSPAHSFREIRGDICTACNWRANVTLTCQSCNSCPCTLSTGLVRRPAYTCPRSFPHGNLVCGLLKCVSRPVYTLHLATEMSDVVPNEHPGFTQWAPGCILVIVGNISQWADLVLHIFFFWDLSLPWSKVKLVATT